LTLRIIGVRCQGEHALTYALFEDDAVLAGQRVLVTSGDVSRPGLVVITPEQLLEFHGPRPTVIAKIDMTPVEPPSGEAAQLLRSLNLSEHDATCGA
jgi:hypothetical protein